MGKWCEEAVAPTSAHDRSELAFAGPFDNWAGRDLGTPLGAKTFCCSWMKSRRRVRMKQRSGSVPLSPQDPARSLISCRVRSLGRQRHRTASPFSAALRTEKGRDVRSSALADAGATHLFSSPTEPRRVGARSSDARPCRREPSGPGLAGSMALSRFSASSGLFTAFSFNYSRMSSRWSAYPILALPH